MRACQAANLTKRDNSSTFSQTIKNLAQPRLAECDGIGRGSRSRTGIPGVEVRRTAIVHYAPLARMAGLEPATASLTVRNSTIELHPNKMEVRTGIEPVSAVCKPPPGHSDTGLLTLRDRFHSVFIQPFADRLKISPALRDRLREHDILRHDRRQRKPGRKQERIRLPTLKFQRKRELDGRPFRNRSERMQDDGTVCSPVDMRSRVDRRSVAAAFAHVANKQIGEGAAAGEPPFLLKYSKSSPSRYSNRTRKRAKRVCVRPRRLNHPPLIAPTRPYSSLHDPIRMVMAKLMQILQFLYKQTKVNSQHI